MQKRIKVKWNIKMKLSFKNLIILSLTFLKIGALTFGGGYAMISIIEREATIKRKWLTSEEMLDIIAIAESTPGPIALNSATYVGAKVAGFLGAFVASISVMLPPIVIITLISSTLTKYFENPYVKWAFLGMRAGVAALILNAVINLGKFLKNEKRPAVYAVFFLSLTLGLLSVFHIISFDNIFIILGTIIFGIIYTFLESFINKRAKKVLTPNDKSDDLKNKNDLEKK
ncbi:MAG: chromate transporter [Clostridia bacterium]